MFNEQWIMSMFDENEYKWCSIRSIILRLPLEQRNQWEPKELYKLLYSMERKGLITVHKGNAKSETAISKTIKKVEKTMKKVEAVSVIGMSYEVVYNWGVDMGAFMACGQKTFIVKLGEALQISNKQSQSLYVAMVKHGYVSRFQEDNSDDWMVCTTRKADEFMKAYHDGEAMIEHSEREFDIIGGYKVRPVEVLMSNAGHYIGRLTVDGEPYCRLSGYYNSRELAEQDLPNYQE